MPTNDGRLNSPWMPFESNQIEQKSNGDFRVKDEYLDGFVSTATQQLQQQVTDLAASVAALQMGTGTTGATQAIDCAALNPRMFLRNADGSDGAQVTEITTSVLHNLYIDLVDSNGVYVGTNVPVAGRLSVVNGMGSEVFDNSDNPPTNKYIYTPPSSGSGVIEFTVGANDAMGNLQLCSFTFPINVVFAGLSSAGMTPMIIQANDISESNYGEADFEGMTGEPSFWENAAANGVTSVGTYHGRRAVRIDLRPFPSQTSRPSTRSLGNFNLPSGTTAYRVMFDICLLYTSPSPRDRQKSRMPSSA